MSHRPGVQMDGEHGLWCARGKVRNLSQAVRGVAEHTGSVWTPVVAIRREDAERLGYNDAESWRLLVCACAPEIARGYKIPLEHLRWYAAFHRKEDSVHIHMVVFSSDPKEGYLTRQGIQQVKSAFGRRIFQQDLLHVYEQKTKYRDALGRDAERTMAELITQMETDQLQNENLERLVLELAQRLHNTQGKKVYGYLPPKTKALVDAIVDELAKDERVTAAYNLWNQMREEVCRTYSEQLPERLPLSRQGVEDALHIGQKAHIEHLVRLVQHHHRNQRQLKRVAADVVQNAARRAHDDGRLLETPDLSLDRLAAVDRRHFGVRVFGEFLHLAGNL